MFPFIRRVCIESQFMITAIFIDKIVGRNFSAHVCAWERVDLEVKSRLKFLCILNYFLSVLAPY